MTATMGSAGRSAQYHERKVSVQRFRFIRRLDDFIASWQTALAVVFALLGMITAICALLGITSQELNRTLPF